MGSPQFAADVLAGIVEKHQVVCVVTQPDTVAGRGHQMCMSAVKQFALAHDIPVLQPAKISLEAEKLREFQPDIIVTCAFGQILRQSVLDAAPHGVINVHGSLLPKYRGAAPVQWSVINGDKTTGVTILQTELGLDCGPMICKEEIPIEPAITGGELLHAMVPYAVKALLTALTQIEKGTAKFEPQDHAQATMAPMLNKEMARFDWQKPARVLANLVRGVNPWPVAWFVLNEEPVKVYQATAVEMTAQAGAVVQCDAKNGLLIGCGEGALRIDSLQVPGKKIMAGKDFCNGRNLRGVILK
ncbi:MAG: methionyl-tRNA formyltransferase [Eubacteriales bacterium]|nr:methionyl-tRNA formyltransferase [Eubacteriales bacterium]